MNTADYAIQHAEALADYPMAFDGAANEAVIDAGVGLDDYAVVVWILGEESTVEQTFSASERSLVADYLANGGNLFVSGSEIGWHLDEQDGDPDFYENALHANYLADDAGSRTVAGESESMFEGISLSFDDGSEVYNVDWPDRIDAVNGATRVMHYTGAGSGGAAVAFAGGSPERRVIMLSFPFETMIEAGDRRAVRAAAMDYLCEADNSPCAAGNIPDGVIFEDGFE